MASRSSDNRKKATINDVAQLAGVSKKTASRVLNNSPQVTEATRKKVLAVMEQLNYSPDPQARGLAFKRSFLLGLVYDNPNALYISDIQKGILRACRGTGYELIMHPGDFGDARLMDEVTAFAARARIDGLILLSPISQVSTLANRLKKAEIPYVRISPKKIDTKARVVISNDKRGAEKMTEYLISLGHRRIGFVAGPASNLSAQQKFEGFSETMAKHKLTARKTLIEEGEHTFESGVEAGNVLLGRAQRPTAIFASNDAMASGVLRSAALLGIQVPDELSVAGYDDNALASVVWPDLTTIRQPVEQMGELAASKLLAQLSTGKSSIADQAEILPELVVRHSTSPLY